MDWKGFLGPEPQARKPCGSWPAGVSNFYRKPVKNTLSRLI